MAYRLHDLGHWCQSLGLELGSLVLYNETGNGIHYDTPQEAQVPSKAARLASCVDLRHRGVYCGYFLFRRCYRKHGQPSIYQARYRWVETVAHGLHMLLPVVKAKPTEKF